MNVGELSLKNGRLETVKSKVINQSQLTSDCWLIQFWGIDACKKCKVKNTRNCGGKKIRSLIRKGEFPENGL